MTTETILEVSHETTYQYGTRVEVARHLAHLTPQTSNRQTLLATSLSIDPPPQRRTSSLDAFGNLQTFFSLYTPHDSLRVRATSRVELRESASPTDVDRSPAWKLVADALRYSARTPLLPASEFTFASPFVPLHDELRDYAAAAFPAGRPLARAALELMHRIHGEFTYRSGSTEISTPVLEVFRRREGVCQDFAHLMTGCLRALGLAARYVSGYLETRPPDGEPAMVGADASHAWISVWCPTLGWFDLDPTNDLIVETAHVTLAVGRDFGDVMPLRGVIQGGGDHDLAVAVDVRRVA